MLAIYYASYILCILQVCTIHTCIIHKLLQVASLASLTQLLSPRSPTVRNPAPDSSLCRAAPRLRPLQLLLAACVRFSCCSRRHPLQLLLPVCLRFQLLLPDCAPFSCCSPLASASAAAPDRVRFGCYSPIPSTAAPRLRLLNSSPCPGPMFSNILRGVRGSVNKLKYEGRASL